MSDVVTRGINTPGLSSDGSAVSFTFFVAVDSYRVGDNGTFFDLDYDIYLSDDQIIDASDVRLLSTTGTMSEHGREFGVTVDLPPDLADGEYYIGVAIDPSANLFDTNTDNNTSISQAFRIGEEPEMDVIDVPDPIRPAVRTRRSIVDLMVENVSFSDTVWTQNEVIQVNWDVRNEGRTEAPSSASALTITGGQIHNDHLAELLLTDPETGTIGAKQSSPQGEPNSLVVPQSLLAGVYFAQVTADTGQVVFERDENNNTSSQVRIIVAPNGLFREGDLLANALGGGADNDLLLGEGAADTLFGFLGHDILDGGTGEDFIAGGEGHDTLIGGSGADQLWAEGGDDVLSGGADNDLLVGGLGNDNAAGDGGDDQLWVQEGDDTATGGDGNDLLVGGLGNDFLAGGASRDALWGELGDDTLEGGSGDDIMVGGVGLDVLSGGDGDDELYGQDGNDTLDGGNDRDILVGDGGNDVLRGGADRDELWAGAGDDTLEGGAGMDILVASLGDDVLFGGDETDELYGEAGNDVMHGEGGDDILIAWIGDDTLNGGSGTDLLYGQGGSDTFVIAANTGIDYIGDFAPGVDRIDLTAYGHINDFDELLDLSVDTIGIQHTNSVIIAMDFNNAIIIDGWTKDNLMGSDFDFAA